MDEEIKKIFSRGLYMHAFVSSRKSVSEKINKEIKTILFNSKINKDEYQTKKIVEDEFEKEFEKFYENEKKMDEKCEDENDCEESFENDEENDEDVQELKVDDLKNKKVPKEDIFKDTTIFDIMNENRKKNGKKPLYNKDGSKIEIKKEETLEKNEKRYAIDLVKEQNLKNEDIKFLSDGNLKIGKYLVWKEIVIMNKFYPSKMPKELFEKYASPPKITHILFKKLNMRLIDKVGINKYNYLFLSKEEQLDLFFRLIDEINIFSDKLEKVLAYIKNYMIEKEIKEIKIENYGTYKLNTKIGTRRVYVKNVPYEIKKLYTEQIISYRMKKMECGENETGEDDFEYEMDPYKVLNEPLKGIDYM